MNAKKIMGAVLVALLAAALFVGAGAAVDAKDDLGTVFVYQNTSYKGTWTGEAGSVTFLNGVIEKLPAAGYYENESAKIYVSYPTAVISAVANASNFFYSVIGSNLYLAEGLTLNVSVQAPAEVAIHDILITYPNGVQMTAWEVLGLENYDKLVPAGAQTNFLNGSVEMALSYDNVSTLLKGQTGEFKLQALFAKVGQLNATGVKIINDDMMALAGDHQLVKYTPDKYLFAQDIYTFTVVDKEEDVTISASVDKVLEGKAFTVTITGEPGEEYTLTSEDGINVDFEIISAGGYAINVSSGEFKMPSSGTITIYVSAKADDDDEVTFKVDDTDAEVTIEVLEPSVTATLSASSYIIGDVIKVTLTTDGELNTTGYYFTLTGTNFEETKFKDDGSELIKQNKDKVYELETTSLGKKVDVGTYTIKVYDDETLVATVPVALKQPLISIDDAPEVVVQGKKAEFVINAEATENITAYIFGTNFFMNLSMADNISVKDKKNAPNMFTVTIPAVNTTNMSAGQYFAVFQHPMYDDKFNIGVQGSDIVLNETADVYNNEHVITLFNVDVRQTANAAQALCDNLDSQNIDDMYVKASFFVVGKDESFTISEIPTTIAQGETLTISGVSTANADGTVTVEMISTAFAAVPKETVGSAAFIAVSTKVAEDGTWEITMDTSDLNVDEYSLKVAVTPVDGKTETWKNVNINVVEAADEPEQPEQPGDEPEQPGDEPVAPETPGFGALAALAGLGAVAVLLLRRE